MTSNSSSLTAIHLASLNDRHPQPPQPQPKSQSQSHQQRSNSTINSSFVRGSFMSSSLTKVNSFNQNNSIRSRSFKQTHLNNNNNQSSNLISNKTTNNNSSIHNQQNHLAETNQSVSISNPLTKKQIFVSSSSLNENLIASSSSLFTADSMSLNKKSSENNDQTTLSYSTSPSHNSNNSAKKLVNVNELFPLPPRPTSRSVAASKHTTLHNSASKSNSNINTITNSMESLLPQLVANKTNNQANTSISASSGGCYTSGIGSSSTSSLFTPSSSSLSPRCTSPNSMKSQMPFKIRSSKYRHVYGNPHKEDVCYKNIKITKNAAHDSAFCAINPKFVAIVTEECGGGAFIVVPIRQTGRVDINIPKVSGHRGPVLDLKWNPFNDNEIASCSEDTTIKVWQIEDDGLYENLNQWTVDLHGHQRRVTQIEWHPTAENIMISCGADFQVLVWNLEKAEPIRIINCHSDTIQSMYWNRNGSLFTTTCKDKKIRVIDPRNGIVVHEFDGHQGSKTSKVIMLGCGTKLFTTGFSKLSERQIALWDMKDLSKPIQMELVDPSSGALIPYYDYESKIVYVAGKGDGNIRYYEITDSEPYIHYLSEYKSSAPQRGLGFMPKRGLDVTKNEIFRFYKLHATGNICEPISMIVPRKAEVFQEDIYPDTASSIPSMSCDEWIAGENRDPILVSMKDGAVAFMPKIITYKQLGFSELGNGNNHSRRKNEKYFSQSNGINNNTNDFNNKSNNLINSVPARNSIVNNPLMPFVESHSKTVFNTNSRSAFNKVCQQSPPSSPNQKSFSNNSNHQTEATTINLNNSNRNLNNLPTANGKSTSVQDDEITEKSLYGNETALNRKNDLESSYLTSLSRNPVTLRKTESLKLESVQNIRNRFNRVSSHHIGTLTRNHSHRQSESSAKEIYANSNINNQNNNLNNSAENLNSRVSNLEDNDLLPPPPNLVQSPILSYKTGPPTTPTPLILSTASLSSSSSSSSSSNGNQNGPANGCGEFISYGVKKRVWTPIQPTNGLTSKSIELTNGLAANNFSELQKSYFRLLEEKNSLKEQLIVLETKNKQLEEELSSRDKRIESLENRVNKFLTESFKMSEIEMSDC